MECPKCGHAQDDAVKCESCGIYFAKFRQPTSATKVPRESASAPGDARSSSGPGWGTVVVAVLITTAAVVGLTRNGAEKIPLKSAVTPPIAAHATATEQPLGQQTSSPPQFAPSGLEAQLAKTFPARNEIEAARNATVFIKTEWGLGSGFIVDKNCLVVTNRHVVETDGARVAENVVQAPEMQSRMIIIASQLRTAIDAARQRRRALEGQPGTNVEQLELDARIQTMKTQLADLPGYVSQVISDKVDGAGRKGFKAILVDGTEFKDLHASVSDRFDLATFTLPASNCPYIKRSATTNLVVGERLYTIGNPSGLTYTVTSGVFSGQRMVANQRYLQTDAPISPGNSGGPLITENGQVVGINTLAMRGIPGVGLAIPIDTVAKEFD